MILACFCAFWVFIHIEDKELAIKNIVSSLTENGVAII